jgi:hypothetical protein
MGEMRNAHRILVRSPEGQRHLRPGSSCEDNFKMDVKEIGCKVAEWTQLAGGLL